MFHLRSNEVRQKTPTHPSSIEIMSYLGQHYEPHTTYYDNERKGFSLKPKINQVWCKHKSPSKGLQSLFINKNKICMSNVRKVDSRR